jgi:hypothetical protein
MDYDNTVAEKALTQDVPAAVRQRQLAAVKHGLYVRAPSGLRLRSRRVRRLAAKVWRALPWLQPSDAPAVQGWAELEIVTSRLFAAVLEKGEPGTTDLYRRTKALQLSYEDRLGMNPTTRAELGLTVSQSMTFQERLAAALKKGKPV